MYRDAFTRCNLVPMRPYIWTAQRTKSPGCFLFLLLFSTLFIYLGLHWVLVAVHGLSLVAGAGATSLEPEGLALDRQIHNHWTPREVPCSHFKTEETETHEVK